jgi:hypothetical protein
VVSDLVGLIALVPEPTVGREADGGDQKALAAWKALLNAFEKPGAKYARIYRERRALATRERLQPPPAMRKVSFCSAPATMNVPEE